ncbi:MAG: DUF4019 domain-containing protein [Alcaligenaceae bacterium]|nr:MAG: DUF4019 domain-containing protein [Alcaligenaceae bacterium]
MKPALVTLLCAALALALSSTHAQSPSSRQEEKATAPDISHTVAASNQDRQWQPTAEQQRQVVRDALTYLTTKDARQFAEAYALFTPSQKSAVSFSRWEADMRVFYGGAGAAEGRTLKKVTWYKNPANAPAGIYAAVDFSSQFAELSLHCGFVAMQMQMDGSFGVAREEENSISKREMTKLTPEALQRIRAQYRC